VNYYTAILMLGSHRPRFAGVGKIAVRDVEARKHTDVKSIGFGVGTWGYEVQILEVERRGGTLVLGMEERASDRVSREKVVVVCRSAVLDFEKEKLGWI
jgi:hypothetical protein